MSKEVFLDDLSLDDLQGMASAIAHLVEAGLCLKDRGHTPRFYLTPGFEAAISVNWAMPFLTERLQVQSRDPSPAEDDAILDKIIGERSVEDFHKRKMAEYYALKKFHDPAEFFAPTPSAEDFVVPVVTDGAEFPIPAEPLPGLTWAAGAFVDNAPDQPAPACPPGSASALAASSRPLAWSDAEIDLTISLIVAAVQQGQTRSVGIERASVKMGRGLDAVRKYVTRHLQDRIAEALQRSAADPHLPEPPPDADALTAHLLSMPRKDGWTLERDLDLAAMSVENGWGSQDIAVDLGLDTKAVKARWDALTGLVRDDKTDKWVRRYAGHAVLDRLKTLSGRV